MVRMLSDCPQCRLPCTVEPRGRWGSTAGPVAHVYVRCVAGHWFLGPADRLQTRLPDPPSPGDRPLEHDHVGTRASST